MTAKRPTRALVCGSREWGDAYAILRELRALPESVKTVIHGDCRGADTLVAGIAESEGFEVVAVPAHWKHTADCPPNCGEYVGKGAGPIRNRKMLAMRPDVVLAFPMAGSRGTIDMVRVALKQGVEVRVYDETTGRCEQVSDVESVLVQFRKPAPGKRKTKGPHV